MNIDNSFLYLLINQFIDLDNIINICKSSGKFEENNNVFFGKYFINDNARNLELSVSNDIMKCHIYYDNMDERACSCKSGDGYMIEFTKTIVVQNEKNIYSEKEVIKKMCYNIEKDFTSGMETEIFIARVTNMPIKFDIEKDSYIRIDENMILRKHEILSSFNPTKNCLQYMYTDNFKDGIFASHNIKSEESYMCFNQIDEDTYNNLNQKKYKKIYKNI
ncbi:MAG: hypothetical protein NC181_03735 [Clostridium sp.]|nr:hypothetical protein [Clostridium sp.]MCM1444268.1 hypothetical protein [Candidatus Amulumruptor caecigallinarius]